MSYRTSLPVLFIRNAGKTDRQGIEIHWELKKKIHGIGWLVLTMQQLNLKTMS